MRGRAAPPVPQAVASALRWALPGSTCVIDCTSCSARRRFAPVTTISEYAAQHGISPRRARALAQQGRLPARRVGRAWVLDEGVATTPAVSTRPMSERTRRLFLRALSDQTLREVTGSDRRRIAAYLGRLRASDRPAALIRAWFRGAHLPTGFTLGVLLVRAALEHQDDVVAERLARPQRRYLNSPERLARVVADERAIHGLSRAQLADRAGTTPGDVAAVEAGRPVDTMLTVLRVVNALDVRPLALPTGAVRDSA